MLRIIVFILTAIFSSLTFNIHLGYGGEPGNLRWKFKTGSIDSSPAIDKDGTIYVGDSSYLYAVNPDGTLKWKFEGCCFNSSPVIGENGTIYVTDYGDLLAINPDGTLKWKFEADFSSYSSPAVGKDGIIYVGSKDRYLYAINPDGTLKWKFRTDEEIYYSSPVIANDGTIYVGSDGNELFTYLYAIYSTSKGPANSPWPMFHHDVMHTGRAGKTSTNPINSISFSLSLRKGWNLKGTSYDFSIPTDNNAVVTIWTWRNNEWYVWSGNKQIIKLIKFYGLSMLLNINAGEGFWINAQKDSEFKVNTNSNSPISALYIDKGWNLHGVSCPVDISTFDKPEILAVWKWKENSWQFWSPDSSLMELAKEFGLNLMSKISANDGFWIKAAGETTISTKCETILQQESSSNQTTDMVDGYREIASIDLNGTEEVGPIYNNHKIWLQLEKLTSGTVSIYTNSTEIPDSGLTDDEIRFISSLYQILVYDGEEPFLFIAIPKHSYPEGTSFKVLFEGKSCEFSLEDKEEPIVCSLEP
jgi:hypothetical protein